MRTAPSAGTIERIATLIDPVKLTALAPREANSRVQKYVTQLASWNPAKLTIKAMLQNFTIA